MSDDTTLAPCPFCGQPAKFEPFENCPGWGRMTLRHKDCFSKKETEEFPLPEEVAERWNRRAPDARDARIAELEAELVAEAKKTASEKTRADQMTEQHRMQAKMHAEATEEIVRLKTQLGGAFSTSHDPGPAAIATLQGMGYKHHGGVLWKPPVGKAPATATPWYPDYSGEWVEVPEDLMEMPAGVNRNAEVQVLMRGERYDKCCNWFYQRARWWAWDAPAGSIDRIVAYKVVKP